MAWLPDKDRRDPMSGLLRDPIITIDTSPWADGDDHGYLLQDLQSGEVYSHEQFEIIIDRLFEGYSHISAQEVDRHNQAVRAKENTMMSGHSVTSEPRAERVAKPGYVYLITNANLIKIGVSKNPEARMKQLQISSPHPLTMLRCALVADPLSVETHLHTTFRHKRQSGEWFALTSKEQASALSYLDEQEDRHERQG